MQFVSIFLNIAKFAGRIKLQDIEQYPYVRL